MSHYQKATFLLSVADVKQLPPDLGIEVAIVGRSNAGKSSVINKITQNKSLARVSKTPGRTQMINLFTIDESRRFADLPGYGYARVPLAAKRKWEKTINEYIQGRESLRGLVLVMDIRHPMRDLDWQLIDYCESREMPVHILLNKSDKLSNNEVNNTVRNVKSELEGHEALISYQVFSALKGVGVKELHLLLDKWYNYLK